MKIRKRLLSLTLAVMLIVAMAVSVSAASFPFQSTYDGCDYNTSNSCGTSSFNSLIELTSCPAGNYEDYLLHVYIEAYDVDESICALAYGNRQPYVSSASGTGSNLSYIKCYHSINNNRVATLTVRAG